MQPRTSLGPMVAGALAWVVLGRESCYGLLAWVGEALAQALGHVMLPWRPAGGDTGLDFGCETWFRFWAAAGGSGTLCNGS